MNEMIHLNEGKIFLNNLRDIFKLKVVISQLILVKTVRLFSFSLEKIDFCNVKLFGTFKLQFNSVTSVALK